MACACQPVNDVGEPCAGEPHARFDVAAGGNPGPVGKAVRSPDASRRPYKASITLAVALAYQAERGARAQRRRLNDHVLLGVVIALHAIAHGGGDHRRHARRGRPCASAGIRAQLHDAALSAGVRRRFAPHQLRDAHAVEMSREGISLIVIQRQLGHADLAITSRYLRRIDNAEIIAAVHDRPAPMIPADSRQTSRC